MTFEEWMRSLKMTFNADNLVSQLKVVWDASAMNEREACAALAEDTAAGREAEAIADAIRKRSNVELRGGPLAARPA